MNDRSNTPRQVINSREDVFVFGKHKGHTVQIVLDEEPSYLVWLEEEKIVKMSQEIYNEAQELDAQEEDYYGFPDYFLADDPPY